MNWPPSSSFSPLCQRAYAACMQQNGDSKPRRAVAPQEADTWSKQCVQLLMQAVNKFAQDGKRKEKKGQRIDFVFAEVDSFGWLWRDGWDGCWGTAKTKRELNEHKIERSAGNKGKKAVGMLNIRVCPRQEKPSEFTNSNGWYENADIVAVVVCGRQLVAAEEIKCKYFLQ